MNTRSVVDGFRRMYREQGSPKRAAGEKKYLKSQLHFYGATKPGVRQAVRLFHEANPDLTRDALIELVQALWRTDYHELRSTGIALLERCVDLLGVADMALVEDLVRRSETWAYVDWLAVNVGGTLVLRYKSARKVLPRWSRDEYMWIRRASMLVLLPSLKADDSDFPMFSRFAASMLEEKEFFIRKSIGWILRETGKKRPEECYGFLRKHVDGVSGLTLREGSKYLPAKLRRDLLARLAARPK